MSSKDQNLTKVNSSGLPKGKNFKIHIAVSEWNSEITMSLLSACKRELIENSVSIDNIIVVKVPGSFELPFAAKQLIKQKKPDAVICLGCVIKGETQHDEYINTSIANGITNLSLTTDIPVIFGVLTVNNKQQALDRAGGVHGNKGVESAQTALKMIQLKIDLGKQKSSIGF